ncbi:MAG: calcium/sodium antiporter [Thermoplasmata archaeon]
MLLVLGWTLILAFGVYLLVKGADLLVEGGSNIAAYLGVSTLIIGLTLVSFGTSLPELASSLNALFKGRSGISVGNVIGSNIANILLVLGVSSIIKPISVDRGIIKREIPMMFGAMGLFLLFAGPFLSSSYRIERWQGIGLLVALIAYLLFFGSAVMKEKGLEVEVEIEPEVNFNWPKNISKVTVGIIGVIIGSELAIRSAVFYIERFDLIEGVVGLTIIAIATSLPELSTSAVAAFKEHANISLGNVIGSNTFNVLMVIGISAALLPLTFSGEIYSSFVIMVGASVFLTTSMYTGKKLSRIEGVVMLVGYFAYLVYLF